MTFCTYTSATYKKSSNQTRNFKNNEETLSDIKLKNSLPIKFNILNNLAKCMFKWQLIPYCSYTAQTLKLISSMVIQNVVYLPGWNTLHKLPQDGFNPPLCYIGHKENKLLDEDNNL